MFDDVPTEDGHAPWIDGIDARAYLVKYGLLWNDLDRIDEVCPSCGRVVQAAAHHSSRSQKGDPAAMKPRTSFSRSGIREYATCSRCHGFMVPSFTDSLPVEMTEKSATAAWRCVNCGEWIDATVVTNRKRAGVRDGSSRPPLTPLSRRRWRRQARVGPSRQHEQ